MARDQRSPIAGTDAQGRLVLRVRVVPGASRSEVSGVIEPPEGARLKVRIAAAAHKGQANAALLELLADRLGVKPRAIEIVQGHGSPDKSVAIAGLPAREAEQHLGLSA